MDRSTDSASDLAPLQDCLLPYDGCILSCEAHFRRNAVKYEPAAGDNLLSRESSLSISKMDPECALERDVNAPKRRLCHIVFHHG
ncbi:uncharacterized protein V6R79_017137 [Siganus canaliculatus]